MAVSILAGIVLNLRDARALAHPAWIATASITSMRSQVPGNSKPCSTSSSCAMPIHRCSWSGADHQRLPVGGNVSVAGSLNSASAIGDVLSLGTAGRYTDRPTITYTPLTGAHFMHVLMTPIPPPALFMLIEQGWPVDMLMQIGVQRINGMSNSKSGARGQAADPDFGRLLMAFQRLQASGALGLRVEVSKESKLEGMVMTISQKNLPPEIQADRDLVRKLLGVRPDLKDSRLSMAGYQIKMTLSLYRPVPDYKYWLNWAPTSRYRPSTLQNSALIRRFRSREVALSRCRP